MMPAQFPGSQISVVVETDGVRRFASAERQVQPMRILAVVDRSPYTLDLAGAKHAYIPFSAKVVLDGHLAQRSEQGLHFDFAVTLCDARSNPAITLSGTCRSRELGTAILESIAEFTGTSLITTPASIDLLLSNRDGLGLADVSSNPVFCLNPPWLFGVDLELARQANQKALAPRIEAYAPRSSVIAYTDGSLPHHGKDRGAGAMLTIQGHWASQISPKNFSRSPLMAETTGALLALRHTPADSDLTIFSDNRALVKSVNDIAGGRLQTREPHHIALEVAIARRSGSTRALWVRGHNGNCYNEAADRMAVLMARHFNAGIDPVQTHSLMQMIIAEELAGLTLAV
ncbi:RNase H family protein [Glutamicibacter mishrai]|uniref:RNase H family protein n=1 Tax=Glutamicibacter mishrai TaxID=1775880 RepID=UPI0032EB1AC6